MWKLINTSIGLECTKAPDSRCKAFFILLAHEAVVHSNAKADNIQDQGICTTPKYQLLARQHAQTSRSAFFSVRQQLRQ